MSSKFSVSVKDVRAIKEAEVELNGITVLSGENGCGKSTLAKLLYGFLNTAVKFDSVLYDMYTKEFSRATSILNDFIPKKKVDEYLESDNSLFDDYIPRIFDTVTTVTPESYVSDIILPRIKAIRDKYIAQEYSITGISFTRLLNLYERRVRKVEAKTVAEILNDYENYMTNVLQDISSLKATHSLNVFSAQISKYFNDDTTKWNFTFKEYGSNLIDKKNKTVILQKSFSEVFYIDVPTLFDSDFYRSPTRNSVLSDLRDALINSKGTFENTSISNIIEESLKGKISRRDDVFSQIFVYTAKNGDSIPLSQAASGLKCFAVLERLFSNGYLKEDTLLIIDEPEVHLHPKWIVEYARVLVLIQKYMHTTILIASHNPDMISAIKYISEKEQCSDNLTFYIAKEVDSEGFGKFKFTKLGTDIEEIFSSFNIALDRINLYGAVNAD